jgi:hypothetical protein
VQDARWFEPEAFPGEGGYAGIPGEYRDASVTDEIEAGAVVVSGARRTVVVAVLM